MCTPKEDRFPRHPLADPKPSFHPIPSLLLSTQHCIPALPLPAFSRFMVEGACTAAAAAASRGDAGGSSVAGAGPRGRGSSRRLHVVSRSACGRRHKQVRELRPPTPCWTRCQQLALHRAGQEE